MSANVIDYRVSTLVVLCKDCGQDVGLYPARHACKTVERPMMPALPDKYQKTNIQPTRAGQLNFNSRSMSSGSSSSAATMSSSTSTGFSTPDNSSNSNWASRSKTTTHAPTSANGASRYKDDDDSIYFQNKSSKDSSNAPPVSSGKKLWGKVRENEKWKELSEKNDKPKQTAKIWGKLIQATQNMTSRDERGAESDEDDYEGESHVSRILREHYEKKNAPLPNWLFDGDARVARSRSAANRNRPAPSYAEENNNSHPAYSAGNPTRTGSKRLWEKPGKQQTQREIERQRLRNEDSSGYNSSNSHNTGRISQEENRERSHYNRYGNEDNYHQDDLRNNTNADRRRHGLREEEYGSPVSLRSGKSMRDNNNRYGRC